MLETATLSIWGNPTLLYDSANTPVGQYTSDNSGYVYIENLTVSGRYYLRELENEGYVPDTQMKTVYVTAGETTLIEWKNIPITAQELLCKGWSHHLIHMTAVHLWQNGTLQFKKGGENAKIMRFPQLQSTFCYK